MALPPRHERVPKELYAPSLPNESRFDYKERRKRNQEELDEYLQGRKLGTVTPSSRVLRRILQGKRTISGLKHKEKAYIRQVLGVSDDKLNLLAAVYNGEIHLVGHRDVRDFNFFAEPPYAS